MWKKLLATKPDVALVQIEINYFSLRQSKIPLKLCIASVYFLLVSILPVGFSQIPFCYEDPACGPESWGQYEAICQTGSFQSPINLERSKVTKWGKAIQLVLNKPYGTAQPFYLRNNAHTVSLAIYPNHTSPLLIKGNKFIPNEPYYFSSLHFHWGSNDYVGSEHTINGKSYPLELHMIHRQQSDESKRAVLAVLFKITSKDNPALTPIIDNLQYVLNPSDDYTLVPGTINLTSLLPNKVKVFRYQGSYTTPPCTEGVTWSVFDEFQTVSARQVMAFRSLLGSDGRPMRAVHRPVQPAFTARRKKVYYLKSAAVTVVVWAWG